VKLAGGIVAPGRGGSLPPGASAEFCKAPTPVPIGPTVLVNCFAY
jgi:hypothetical protein